MQDTMPAVEDVRPRRRAVSDALRVVAATTAVGLGLGLLVGGVGGRLAMRALFLTSDPLVRGLTSDDGFPIGRFDLAATLNLLIIGTVVGIIGAFGYLAVRPFLLGPRWLRYAGCAVAGGAVVGSMLVQPDGVDFTLLGPRWFAIALFVALPALFGALVGPAVDRATRPDGWFRTTTSRWALLPLAVFLFPPVLLLPGLLVAIVLLGRQLTLASPGATRALRSPAVVWPVRLGWASVAVLGAVTLLRDVDALL